MLVCDADWTLRLDYVKSIQESLSELKLYVRSVSQMIQNYSIIRPLIDVDVQIALGFLRTLNRGSGLS